VSFFPHQISDLNLVTNYIGLAREHNWNWPIRYVILLWLSLICRLPFDLKSFDEDDAAEGETARKIEAIGREYLNKTGLERTAAALVLARLYSRYCLVNTTLLFITIYLGRTPMSCLGPF
jgi:tubulin-specific chaperone D